jgi:BirA family transcriptional regulator, biotin operon repressor / biotin---[acetyl-CoA-carboxylase] ligase
MSERPNLRGTGFQPVIERRQGLKTRATFALARLRAELKPFKLHWFPTLGSTNAHAAKMRREGRLLAPAVVLTGRQTAGRGRGSNVWHSPRGVITVSFVLSVHDTLPPQHVPLVAGLAVRNAIQACGISGVGIKWPNDLWFDDRKVAGLLCERFGSIDVIGVGLNANLDVKALPPSIAKTTTSLHQIAGLPIDATTLIAAMAGSLRRSLDDERTSLASVLDVWRTHDVLNGRRIRVSREGEPDVVGSAMGIDPSGRFRVKTGLKVEALLNGTVRLAVR